MKISGVSWNGGPQSGTNRAPLMPRSSRSMLWRLRTVTYKLVFPPAEVCNVRSAHGITREQFAAVYV